MTLTKKQRAFVEAYLDCRDATEAAFRAGYAERFAYTMGRRQLENPAIRDEIERRVTEAMMGPDEVLARLSHIARGSMADFLTVQDGAPVVNCEQAERAGKLGLIKKLKYDSKGRPDIELYDAYNALVQLGKVHALFAEGVQHDDWHGEAIALIRRGEISYEALAREFGDDKLAQQLFTEAGIPLTPAGADSAGEDENA
jgi:hypothetical protein